MSMSIPLVRVRACVCVRVHVRMYKMPECPASDQSSTGIKKTKLMKSGIFSVRYRTEIMNAGMSMLALVCLMRMPSYGV